MPTDPRKFSTANVAGRRPCVKPVAPSHRPVSGPASPAGFLAMVVNFRLVNLLRVVLEIVLFIARARGGGRTGRSRRLPDRPAPDQTSVRRTPIDGQELNSVSGGLPCKNPPELPGDCPAEC